MKRVISLMALTLLALGCQGVDKEKLVNLHDFTLTAHEDWDVIFYGSKEAQLKVPGETYHFDYLNLRINKDEAIDLTGFGMIGANDDNIVYDNDCDTAYDCFYLQIEDTLYEATFTVSSQETPPEDADENWTPDIHVDTQEMIDFLLTAES